MKPKNYPRAPIMGITGINGAGKTLLAVDYGLEAMNNGMNVVSTVDITHPVTGQKSERLVALSQLLGLSDCLLILDEVSAIFSSRSSASLPSEVGIVLQTLRHRNISIIWTAPAWSRCEVIIREITQAQIDIKPIIRRRDPGNLWPTARLCRVHVFSRLDMADEAVLREQHRMKSWWMIPLRQRSIGAYDTMAGTPQVGGLLPSGPCPDCGGSRARVSCTPAIHEDLGLPAPVSRLEYARLRQSL